MHQTEVIHVDKVAVCKYVLTIGVASLYYVLGQLYSVLSASLVGHQIVVGLWSQNLQNILLNVRNWVYFLIEGSLWKGLQNSDFAGIF